MKLKLQTIISASAASVLTFSALAQDTTNPFTAILAQDTSTPKSDRLDDTRQPKPMARPRVDQLNGAAKASDIIGMTVKNYQDETLGKVEDLAVDVESGRVVQVILSTGGYIGIGDTLMAVPPGALHHDVTNKVLHLDANKEKLKGAPKFEMSKWVEYSDPKHLSEVYRHYGEDPALKFIHKGDAVLDDQRKADGTSDKDRMSSESQSMIPMSRLSRIQKASKLMGTAVKNLQDEKLGKVENILVDMSSGRVVAVIISSGGFLGMGDELSAVPPTALRFTKDHDTLQLDASKEMLSSSPHFKANEWPDLSQPSYADGVYRAYKVTPYFHFTTNVTKDADNSARNMRDRDARTLTPLDQGSSKADVSTTAQIRKEIMSGKNMSVNARNVKIITINGQVTLRGPVNNAEEKRLIGKIAINIVRLENVDNQLEVKLTTSSN